MRFATIYVPLMAVVLSGCSGPHQAPEKAPLAGKIGQNCTVQFKWGDGLGASGELPVPPNTGVINGAQVSVSGKLHAVSGDWIAVESAEGVSFIPRESILLVLLNKETASRHSLQ